MRPSIDYLNARASAKPASGGKRYELKRNAVDDAAQYRDLDYVEQYAMRHDAIQAEFQSVMRNMPTFDQLCQPVEDLVF
jgi:hypothetical protein